MAPRRLLSPKLVAAALCAAAVLAALPSVASAFNLKRAHGFVFAGTPAGQAFKAKLHAARYRGSYNNLRYHNGPVMHTDANYVDYWVPSGYSLDQNYKNVVNTFFQDITGTNTGVDVYGGDRQYHDGAGAATTQPSNGGPLADSYGYPANGCHVGSTCITDAQIQTHLSQLLGNSPQAGLGKEYFVYLPSGVTSCIDSTGSQCSGSTYCAYHSSYNIGSTTVLYAVMPYAGVSGCTSGQYPNGSTGGDSAVNVTSHESVETITDPLGNAWYDLAGNEIGDKCAWKFGSALGGPPGSEYNQQMGGGKFWLQMEWSNANSGCVQRY